MASGSWRRVASSSVAAAWRSWRCVGGVAAAAAAAAAVAVGVAASRRWQASRRSRRRRVGRSSRRGLLVACGDRPPLLEPGPQVLDAVAVVVDPPRAGHGCFALLGRNGRAGAHTPDMLAKAMAAVAPIRHHPAWDPGQCVQQRHRLRQLVRLPGRQPKGDRSPGAVRDHAGLGAIAATRAAKRFACASARRSAVFGPAPAAL